MSKTILYNIITGYVINKMFNVIANSIIFERIREAVFLLAVADPDCQTGKMTGHC